MTSNIIKLSALATGSMVLLGLGCSTTQSTTPTATGAATAQRQLLDVSEPPTLEQITQHLPARISVADAGRLLRQIDPGSVQSADHSYKVQYLYSPFLRRAFGAYSLYGGYSPYLTSAFYGTSLYYPYSSVYYPYYLSNGYYYPYSTYSSSAYSYPFLIQNRGLYRPYYYVSPYSYLSYLY